MVSDVQGVNDFSDVLPYILKITCMGRELCNHAQYLLGNQARSQDFLKGGYVDV